MSLKARIEALIFASEQPVPIPALLRALGDESGIDKETVERCLCEIAAEHEARQGGFVLVEVAGGYELRTRPEFANDILRLYNRKPATLSKAALETLAIVAFRQPCTRALIDELRGVDSSGSVRTLLERELIGMAGRADVPGRPHLYRTTPTFLRVFGLRSLKDLPSASEVGEITEEHVLRLEDYRRQGDLSIDPTSGAPSGGLE